MLIKPKFGKLVRLERAPFSVIPEKGANVPNTTYYRRRVLEGDAEIIKVKKAVPPVKGTENVTLEKKKK